MKAYPEHEKLSGVSKLSQQLGAFIEWMGYEKGWSICEYREDMNEYHRVPLNVNEVLAGFYKIDLVKLEEEKVDMINECRKLNETT